MLETVMAVIAVIGAIISYKSASEAKKASTEANDIMNKANVIAKNYQYVTLLLDLHSKRYISEAILYLKSPKLFKKYIDSLAESVRSSQKKFQEGKVEVIFDYIIDSEAKMIYELKDNQKKKALFDSVYRIIEDLELLLPFIDESNEKEGIKIKDFIRQAKSKEGNVQFVNRYGKSFNHLKGHVLKEYEQLCRTNNSTLELPQEIMAFAWDVNELDSKSSSYLFRYDFFKNPETFDKAVQQIKSHYGNYYVYQDLLTAYKKSEFYREGVEAVGK